MLPFLVHFICFSELPLTFSLAQYENLTENNIVSQLEDICNFSDKCPEYADQQIKEVKKLIH